MIKKQVRWVISQCFELCICVFTGVRQCVGGCVPALPMGGVFCRLSPLKVLNGGMVSDDKSEGQTARQAAILYSESYTPPPLCLGHLSLYFRPLHLKSLHLSVICGPWEEVKCKPFL